MKVKPKFARFLMQLCLSRERHDVFLGDLDEAYDFRCKRDGARRAGRWYRYQVVKALPAFIFESLIWSMMMFKNYLKTAFRNLRRNLAFSFINIFGLAVGMACCLLILMWVHDEFSYDKHHEKGDRIFRILSYSTIGNDSRKFIVAPPVIAPEVSRILPDVENHVRLSGAYRILSRYQDKKIPIEKTFIADDTLFDIFSFTFIRGDPATALKAPDSIVLSEKVCRSIFGERDGFEESITAMLAGNERMLRVNGIFKDLPRTSHLQIEAIAPWDVMRDPDGNLPPLFEETFYSISRLYSYLLLAPGSDSAEVEEKINGVAQTKWGETYSRRGVKRYYPLQRLKDIHLKSDFENAADVGNSGDISVVYLFSLIGAFVLIIACFNFINLSTARSANRAREVGIRKVLGSVRGQIVKQFLSESLLVSLISLILALLLVIMFLPSFNTLTGKIFQPVQLLNPMILIGAIAIILFVGLAAGGFPAFILSAFRPIQILQGKLSSMSRNATLRKMLVVFQFAISIFMIINILTVVRQIDYMKNKDLGFKRNQLVIIPFPGPIGIESAERYRSLKDEISKNPSISGVTFSSTIPGTFMQYSSYIPEGGSKVDAFRASDYQISDSFIETYGMELLWGRDFSSRMANESNQNIIINRKAADILGWGADSIGRRITNATNSNQSSIIVGVVENFHIDSLKMEIAPVVLHLASHSFQFISARLHDQDVPGALKHLESVISARSPQPDFTFNHYFIDEPFKGFYMSEEKLGYIYLIFGFITVLVASLGLYGLASYTIEQRMKEMGIRKVFGASFRNIILLIAKDFIGWVIAANLIAWPLAYIMTQQWLTNFAYRTPVTPVIFIAAGIITSTIAAITISYHSVKCGISNPVESLRYE